MSEGDGMAEVTLGDREKAVNVLASAQADAVWIVNSGRSLVEHIAVALAEEREKARVPFLAVMRKIPPDSPELRWVADRIQRAAEETP